MYGLCSYTDVKFSRVDLCDLAAMNELIDIKEYNDAVRDADRTHALTPPASPFDAFRR
jgi:hypothetical protein